MAAPKIMNTRSQFQYGLGIRLNVDNFPSNLLNVDFEKGIVESRFIVPKGVYKYTGKNLPARLKVKYHKIINEKIVNDKSPIPRIRPHNVIVLEIPPKMSLAEPIYLKQHVKTGAVATQLVILAKAHSKGIVIVNKDSMSTAQIYSNTINVLVEQGAELTLIALENYNCETFVFNTVTAQVGEKGKLTMLDVLAGGKIHYHHATTNLIGKNSQITHDVCFYTKSQAQQFDVLTQAIHAAKSTVSLLRSRGVVESGKAITQGKVVINKKGSKAQSIQRADLLLIDEKAQGEAIPILEVHNDNVTCQHGSTISKINTEQLFYLQSRGISKEDANKLITKGFLGELLANVPELIEPEVYAILEGKQ